MPPLRQRRTAAERLGAAFLFGVAVRCHRATVRRCDISSSAVGGMHRLILLWHDRIVTKEPYSMHVPA